MRVRCSRGLGTTYSGTGSQNELHGPEDITCPSRPSIATSTPLGHWGSTTRVLYTVHRPDRFPGMARSTRTTQGRKPWGSPRDWAIQIACFSDTSYPRRTPQLEAEPPTVSTVQPTDANQRSATLATSCDCFKRPNGWRLSGENG